MVEVGHAVKMGSRSASNEKALAWSGKMGANASCGTFAKAAAFGELVFNCTRGAISLEALSLAGAENLAGKVLVDVANPLDTSKGWPPFLTFCNDDSLAEQIQRSFPEAKVVKTLNTVWCGIMVNPRRLFESHHIFISGNDTEAKSVVRTILLSFGWEGREVIDLGDISTARGTEMYLALWSRVYGALENVPFNIKIVRED